MLFFCSCSSHCWGTEAENLLSWIELGKQFKLFENFNVYWKFTKFSNFFRHFPIDSMQIKWKFEWKWTANPCTSQEIQRMSVMLERAIAKKLVRVGEREITWVSTRENFTWKMERFFLCKLFLWNKNETFFF